MVRTVDDITLGELVDGSMNIGMESEAIGAEGCNGELTGYSVDVIDTAGDFCGQRTTSSPEEYVVMETGESRPLLRG